MKGGWGEKREVGRETGRDRREGEGREGDGVYLGETNYDKCRLLPHCRLQPQCCAVAGCKAVTG